MKKNYTEVNFDTLTKQRDPVWLRATSTRMYAVDEQGVKYMLSSVYNGNGKAGRIQKEDGEILFSGELTVKELKGWARQNLSLVPYEQDENATEAPVPTTRGGQEVQFVIKAKRKMKKEELEFFKMHSFLKLIKKHFDGDIEVAVKKGGSTNSVII